jgi:hypothetical protein
MRGSSRPARLLRLACTGFVRGPTRWRRRPGGWLERLGIADSRRGDRVEALFVSATSSGVLQLGALPSVHDP